MRIIVIFLFFLLLQSCGENNKNDIKNETIQTQTLTQFGNSQFGIAKFSE